MNHSDSDTSPAHGRGVLPHRDPTFEAVVRAIERGGQPVDWKLTGPLMVRRHDPNPASRGGLDRSREWLRMPSVSDKPLQLNLEPDVAAAVLRYLDRIAERRSSRSGKTTTYGMKKAPAATGAQSNRTDKN